MFTHPKLTWSQLKKLPPDNKSIKSEPIVDFIWYQNDNIIEGGLDIMKAELYKRLFRAIFSEDILSLKKIAITIIQEERKLGHNVLADSLEKISITEKPKYTLFEGKKTKVDYLLYPRASVQIHNWYRISRENN
ncbi:hypothetical protein GCWU000341_01797 [Oribacterium sp. oral taxon 078 str. F0262]|nr:hypothetical protein GCWU000341_01797 [Oribacterium sp. oral taxon 078 str. F0262]